MKKTYCQWSSAKIINVRGISELIDEIDDEICERGKTIPVGKHRTFVTHWAGKSYAIKVRKGHNELKVEHVKNVGKILTRFLFIFTQSFKVKSTVEFNAL